MWIKKEHLNEQLRIGLYKKTRNSSAWGLTANDELFIENNFHRKQQDK